LIYLFQIITPFTMMASFFTAFQKAMGATERIHELLNTPQEQPSGNEGRAASERQAKPDFSQPLVFDGVSFSYDADKRILSDIRLTIRPGQTVAFVGPSGAGKTTIFSLIERFYAPTEGRIRLGETDIADLSLPLWRQAIGYVSQDSPLMSGTIRDNICYGIDRRIDDRELKQAAELANAAEFIARLPAGYDTEVGERGVRLSGGQRQRIAIARALLRNPQLLLLDEATSSLDSESEALVQQALQNLKKDRTTLVIAHRLSTVFEADQIIVLERGRITGQGTHEELLNTHPLYQKLVNQQMKAALASADREQDFAAM